MRLLRIFLASLVLAATVGACAGLDGIKVDTPRKQWALASDSLTAATITFRRLIDEDKVSIETAERGLVLIELGQKAAHDAITLIEAGSDAEALDIIKELTSYVNSVQDIVAAFESGILEDLHYREDVTPYLVAGGSYG